VEHLEGFKKRHPYLWFVVGGVAVVLDNIARVQVIKDMYAKVASVFSGAVGFRIPWPSHLLTWIGACFILFGLVSLFWPRKKLETKQIEAASKPDIQSRFVYPHNEAVLELTNPGIVADVWAPLALEGMLRRQPADVFARWTHTGSVKTRIAKG
jgi:hypothetical protein